MENNLKSNRKNFRFSNDSLEKLNELKKRKSAIENTRFSQNEIIEQAIDYYHSQVFGDKVKDRIIELIENEIHYAVDNALKIFMSEVIAMFQFNQLDILKNQQYNELILKILTSKFNVETHDTARYALVNNDTVWKDEVEKKLKKEQPTTFQYLKIINEAKQKYLKENTEEEVVTHDENNLPF